MENMFTLRIPTSYSCIGKESKSESVPGCVSGNVNEPWLWNAHSLWLWQRKTSMNFLVQSDSVKMIAKTEAISKSYSSHFRDPSPLFFKSRTNHERSSKVHLEDFTEMQECQLSNHSMFGLGMLLDIGNSENKNKWYINGYLVDRRAVSMQAARGGETVRPLLGGVHLLLRDAAVRLPGMHVLRGGDGRRQCLSSIHRYVHMNLRRIHV